MTLVQHLRNELKEQERSVKVIMMEYVWVREK